MTSESAATGEARDAEQVIEALDAITAGDLGRAEGLLTSVIVNTPADYVNETQDPDGTLRIRFGDENAFVHYVIWHEQHGTARKVVWVLNA